jgi:hypothetical protein
VFGARRRFGSYSWACASNVFSIFYEARYGVKADSGAGPSAFCFLEPWISANPLKIRSAKRRSRRAERPDSLYSA